MFMHIYVSISIKEKEATNLRGRHGRFGRSNRKEANEIIPF